MSKPSMIQAPENDKDSLNIQEVKSQGSCGFVVVRNIIDTKLFNPHSAVPDTSIKTLAYGFRCFATINFLKIKRIENPKHSGS